VNRRYTKQDILKILGKLLRGEISYLDEENAVVVGAFRMAEGYSSSYTLDDLSKIIKKYNADKIEEVIQKIKKIIRKRSVEELKAFNADSFKATMKKFASFCKEHLDEIAILAAFGNIAYKNSTTLSSLDKGVIQAIQRSSSEFSTMSTNEIGSVLRGYDDKQIQGFINNVKGILHEQEFVNLENIDGDDIFAEIFSETNHPDTDVKFIDILTGKSWETQLKATDSVSYVKDWLEGHPGEQIAVTNEIAEKLELSPYVVSSGIGSAELTCRIDVVVDKLSELPDDDTIWNYFPTITTISIALIIFGLWRKYRKKEITKDEFIRKSALTSGLKMAKLGSIIFLLSLPVINIITGVCLIYSFLCGVNRHFW